MEKYSHNNLIDFLHDYNNMSMNVFEDEYVRDIFERTIKKNNGSLKKSRKKSEKIIIFNDANIGGLYGTRPTTTNKVSLNLLKNIELLKEYINLISPDSKFNTGVKEGGFQVRVTIVEGICTAALLRIPPYIIGDGASTIESLIDKKNIERSKTAFYKKNLLDINDYKKISQELYSKVLRENEILILSDDISVQKGAESIDVTSILSEDIYKTLENYIATVPGLYTAAVDIKLDQLNDKVFELVNIHSSINTLIHYVPYKGTSVHVLNQYVKSLIVKYKNDNSLKLSKDEKLLLKKLSKFQKERNFYEKNLLNLDLSNQSNTTKLLVKEINKMQSYLNVKKDVAKLEESLFVDEALFRTDLHKGDLNIEAKDVLPLLNPSNSTKATADKALQNIIVPFPGFDSVNFDDNYYYVNKTKKYGASYQLYIQSLRTCAVILLEFEKTKDINYLLKVKELIYAWIDYVSKGTTERMVWYDHPTANRTQTIIHFLYLARENDVDIDEKLFRAVLYKHGEVLMDDKIYKNNNHGLMMDKALLVLGNTLEEEKFFTKGYYRAIETFWYSFSAKGTHLENSPDYHNMVLRMYKELENYLNVRGNSFGKSILGFFDLADEYLDIIKKPNNKLPALGDSGNTLRRTPKSYKNFSDIEAGIGVLQYKGEKTFYTSFVCGYSSQVHKHRDDLSITLNYNGADFIVDSGKFNYNSKSPIRKYITSKDAHSSFSLKSHEYTIHDSNRFTRKVEITGFNFNDNISFIKGSHSDYKQVDAELLRTIVQINNKPILIIIDDSVTEENLDFKQNFNLHENVNISNNDEKLYLTSGNETLTLKQFNNFDSMNIIDGNIQTPIALNTIGFGKVSETKQIAFEKQSKEQNVFITAIYDDSVIDYLNIVYNNEKLLIELDNEEFTLYI